MFISFHRQQPATLRVRRSEMKMKQVFALIDFYNSETTLVFRLFFTWLVVVGMWRLATGCHFAKAKQEEGKNITQVFH